MPTSLRFHLSWICGWFCGTLELCKYAVLHSSDDFIATRRSGFHSLTWGLRCESVVGALSLKWKLVQRKFWSPHCHYGGKNLKACDAWYFLGVKCAILCKVPVPLPWCWKDTCVRPFIGSAQRAGRTLHVTESWHLQEGRQVFSFFSWKSETLIGLPVGVCMVAERNH